MLHFIALKRIQGLLINLWIQRKLDIDTTLETTTTLETNIDTTLENVDTLETGHASANMDEFAEDDEDCEMPLSQNIHRERYLRYKPAYDEEEDSVVEEEEGEEEDVEGIEEVVAQEENGD